MTRQLSTRGRLILCFSLQTLLSLGGLVHSYKLTESKIQVQVKVTRDILESSEKEDSALFRVQALSAEQKVDLIQGISLMYADPDALQKSVHKMLASRYELSDLIEKVEVATHDGRVLETLQETKEAVRRFDESTDKSAALLLKGQKSEGLDVLMNRCTQMESALAASVAKIRNACAIVQANKLDEIRVPDDQRIASERKTLLWLLAGSLVVGLGFILSI